VEKVNEVLVGPTVKIPPAQEGRQRATFNLANIGKVQKTAEETPVSKPQERAPDKPIDEDILKRAWNDFIELKRPTNPDLAMMMNRTYSIEGNFIRLSLNSVEEMMFQPVKTPLITFLRDRTGNSSLLIEVVVEEQAVETVKLHNAKDKFNYMAEKNPVLKELKDRFGLDPDLAF
jgi:DNA polymerase-3 subunit gamma/tau